MLVWPLPQRQPEPDSTQQPTPLVMKIVVIGAGGHANVVIDTLKLAAEHEVVGVVADDRAASEVLGIPLIGGDEVVPRLLASGIQGFLVAVGDNTARRRLFDFATRHGLAPVCAIHPSAVVASGVHIGSGVAMMANSVINSASYIEDNVIVNTGATVDHHAWIGPDVHIAPGCHIAGRVRVGAGSFLGVGVSVIPEITIGERVVIGAGATVFKDVPSDSRVVGAPMRFLEPSET